MEANARKSMLWKAYSETPAEETANAEATPTQPAQKTAKIAATKTNATEESECRLWD